jgi:hypothetical protein
MPRNVCANPLGNFLQPFHTLDRRAVPVPYSASVILFCGSFECRLVMKFWARSVPELDSDP